MWYLLNMVFPAILVYNVFNIVYIPLVFWVCVRVYEWNYSLLALENFQARDKTKPLSKEHAYQATSKDNGI